MSKLKVLFLFLPFIGLACWMMYYINFIQSSYEVILPITGYDPRNLLSGHYIEFNIDWSRANCNQADWNGTCQKDAFSGVNRYYVPENKAVSIESIINKENLSSEIVFAYQKDEKAIVKDLLIEGKTWQEYLQTSK